jgi:hypothetical protein
MKKICLIEFRRLIYLFIVLVVVGCSQGEIENNVVSEIKTPDIATVKIGNLEVMLEDLGEMNWEDGKKACAEIGDGWRLPTKDELNLLYENKDEIGGFYPEYYWSSSVGEKDEWNVFPWIQYFNSSGAQYFNYEGDPGPHNDYRVRAVKSYHSNMESTSSLTVVESSFETVEGTQNCLVGKDWVYPSMADVSNAWKFNSDGTFNYSTTLFGGMSAWGNWRITEAKEINITYTRNTEGIQLDDELLFMPDCNHLKVGSTIYINE